MLSGRPLLSPTYLGLLPLSLLYLPFRQNSGLHVVYDSATEELRKATKGFLQAISSNTAKLKPSCKAGWTQTSAKLISSTISRGKVGTNFTLFSTPSFSTRTWSGGIPEAVIHEKTGLLIEPGDTKALKEALLLLLTNKELAKNSEKTRNPI